MKITKAHIKLVTPAFLGRADQRAEWRSPPIKALIRQWWRLSKASQFLADHPGVDPQELINEVRSAEGRVFGSVGQSDKHKSHRSMIAIQLSKWSLGKLTSWDKAPRNVPHPEVEPRGQVDAHLYLGYGPLGWNRQERKTDFMVLKSGGAVRTALRDGEEAELKIAFPNALEKEVNTVLKLISWFGTIGARSRNGWGSIQITRPATPLISRDELESSVPTVKLQDCLGHEWACAVGKDALGPLVWRTTRTYVKWEQVIEDLARIKIAYRTAIGVKPNADAERPVVADRHILAYPITNHGVSEWSARDLDNRGKLKQEGRLANQLRFKVLKWATDKGEEYFGLAFHLPHRFPQEMLDKLKKREHREQVRQREAEVWAKIHKILDDQMRRI